MVNKKLSKNSGKNEKHKPQRNTSNKSQHIITYHNSGLEPQDEGKHYAEVLAFTKNPDNLSALQKFIKDCQNANSALSEDMKKALSEFSGDQQLESKTIRLSFHGWEIGSAVIYWEKVRFIIAAERLISDAKANSMSNNQWMQSASEEWKKIWIAGIDFHVGFMMEQLDEWLNSSIQQLTHAANFKSSTFICEDYIQVKLPITDDDIAKDIVTKARKKTKQVLGTKENRGGKRTKCLWTQEQINKFVTTVDKLPIIKHDKKCKKLWEYAIDVFEEHDYEQRGIDIILKLPEFKKVKDLVRQCNNARADFRGKGKIPENHQPQAYCFRHAVLLLNLPEVSHSTMKRYYKRAKML